MQFVFSFVLLSLTLLVSVGICDYAVSREEWTPAPRMARMPDYFAHRSLGLFQLPIPMCLGFSVSIQCACQHRTAIVHMCVTVATAFFSRCCLIRSFGDDKLMRHLFQSCVCVFFFRCELKFETILRFFSRDFCLVFNFFLFFVVVMYQEKCIKRIRFRIKSMQFFAFVCSAPQFSVRRCSHFQFNSPGFRIVQRHPTQSDCVMTMQPEENEHATRMNFRK